MKMSINKSVFFILDQQNNPHGAGVVLERTNRSYTAVTCAHVIADIGAKPGDSITVLFYYRKEFINLSAILIERGYSADADVAFIELPEISFGINPLRLMDTAKYQSEISVLSYPGNLNQENLFDDWATVTVLGKTMSPAGYPFIQIRLPNSIKTISGSIVFTRDKKRVVGMVCGKSSDDNKSVLAIPAKTIHDLFPELVLESEEEFITNQQEALTFLEQARSSLFIDSYEEAMWSLKKAQELGLPEDAENDASELKNEITKLHLSKLTRQAQAAEEAKQLNEAMYLWNEIIKLSPENQFAHRNFDMLKRQSSILKMLDEAASQEMAGNLEKSIHILHNVRDLDPDFLPAKYLLDIAQLKAERQSHVTRMMQDAERALKSGLLEESFFILQKVTEFDPDYMPARPLLESLRIKLMKLWKDREEELAQSIRDYEDRIAQLSQKLDIAQEAQNEIDEKLNQAEIRIKQSDAALEAHQKILDWQKKIYVSLAYPNLLSKRFTSIILVYLHPRSMVRLARTEIVRQLEKVNKKAEKYRTGSYPIDADIKVGKTVTVKIESPGIEFLSSTTVKFIDTLTKMVFLAKPGDNCEIGKQMAKITVCEDESGVELFVLPFEIEIVDFVVDHISRPFVYKLVATFSGLGALVMYLLTFFGQVDTTFGLASGTTIGAVAVATYLQFTNLFQRLQNMSGTP